MEQEKIETLLTFFKALGNESRLKVIGTLANRECTVNDLMAALDLKEHMVLQHLAMLKHIGLAAVHSEENQVYYSLNAKTLYQMNKDIFSREDTDVEASKETGNEAERKVLKAYFDGERLIELPLKGKKLQIVLQRLAAPFKDGARYTEHEVNEIMTRFHPDYATLRRELINHGYLAREKGIYWKTTRELQPTEN
jgi:DNA-binding transcriptional ArsR family regulator